MEHLNSWSLIISWSQVCMWTPASLLDLDMYCWSGLCSDDQIRRWCWGWWRSAAAAAAPSGSPPSPASPPPRTPAARRPENQSEVSTAARPITAHLVEVDDVHRDLVIEFKRSRVSKSIPSFDDLIVLIFSSSFTASSHTRIIFGISSTHFHVGFFMRV